MCICDEEDEDEDDDGGGATVSSANVTENSEIKKPCSHVPE